MDKGLDPRGRPNTFTYTETARIADYLDDPKVPLDNKSKPWRDIIDAAGVELPYTMHFKPPGLRTIQPQTIQQSCQKDKRIINTVYDEEKELSYAQARWRML